MFKSFSVAVLTLPVLAFAQAPGFCVPSNVAHASYRPYPDVTLSDMTQRLRRDTRLISAMHSAMAIYDLPDMESVSSGQELLDRQVKFLSEVPFGYTLYFYISDPESGLKYMILQPKAIGPWILAIAGTQSALDWLVDVDLGRSQFSKLQTIVSMFTDCT